MKSRVIVSAIIEKDGEILLGKKQENVGPYPNTWHLPGGGADLDDETIIDAIKREVKEETGLEVKKIERVGFAEDYEPNKHGEMMHYLMLVFHIEPQDKKSVAGSDLVELQWFKKTLLKNLALPRPTKIFFTDLGLLK